MRVARKKAPLRNQIKSVLRTGLTIERLEEDEYFGFEVDRDHLFLLGDFTIAHNCYAILMEELSDKNKDGGDLHPVMYTGSESPKQKQDAKDRFCGGDSRVMLMSLRSGAGLDGLQHHCRIGVFAELDWSPMVHLQDEGRVHRDAQPDPVVMYYLLSTSGSDPIIADILGLKRAQSEGILDPKGAVEHGLDADGQNVKKLAQAILLKHTKALPSGARVVR
jgi:hypothetical protein